MGYISTFLLLILPFYLTISNIVCLLLGKRISQKKKNFTDGLIFGLGLPLTIFLVCIIGFKDWYIPLYASGDKFTEGAYTPIAFESLPTIVVICIVALAGYALPRILGTELPPLIAALCYSEMFLGIALTVVVFIQFGEYVFDFLGIYLVIFSFNYVICSIRLIRDTAKLYAEKFKAAEYNSLFLKICAKILSYSVSLVLVSFILSIPLLLIVIIIMLLFGQRPDSVIRAFTETAEYTLSQKIPPPRLDPKGHYLCTVAACGDEKVVKPLRAGKRCGNLIIVNRQLLIANAFEDLICEKTPHLHKIVRGIYDKYGLPISKHITTKKRSNIVYFIMKPLEWFFLIALYAFDLKPENRIAIQYTK